MSFTCNDSFRCLKDINKYFERTNHWNKEYAWFISYASSLKIRSFYVDYVIRYLSYIFCDLYVCNFYIEIEYTPLTITNKFYYLCKQYRQVSQILEDQKNQICLHELTFYFYMCNHWAFSISVRSANARIVWENNILWSIFVCANLFS